MRSLPPKRDTRRYGHRWVGVILGALYACTLFGGAGDGWASSGPSTSVSADKRISVSTTNGDITVKADFNTESLLTVSHDQYTLVNLEGCTLPTDLPGHPWLPARFINLLIPSGATVQDIEVTAQEKLVAENVLIYPMQPPVPTVSSQNGRPFILPDSVVYASTVKYPAQLVALTGRHTLRGYSFVSLRLNPVRYLPATNDLYATNRMTIRLILQLPTAKKVASMVNNAPFQRMVREITINGDMFNQATEFAPQATQWEKTASSSALTEYLIITSTGLSDAFQVLADHRAAALGLSTAVLTTETIHSFYPGADEQERIRACIIDYVNHHGTLYVVLGGDDTIVPDRDCAVNANGISENHMPTDLYYAGLDSTWDEDGDGIHGEADIDESGTDEGDLAADLFLGRIPVRTNDQASAYIDKLIRFDNNPPAADSLLMLGEHLGAEYYPPYTVDDRPSETLDDGHPGFRAHTPVSDTEMWVRRLYRDQIQPSVTPTKLGYFFDTLTSWDSASSGDYALNDDHVKTILNQEWYHLFMMTHGYNTGWSLENGIFDDGDATAVSGDLGVIYTGTCLTGHFDGAIDPSLSEAFLRDAEGPVAYFGCSRFGWYLPDHPPADATSLGGPSMEYAHSFYNQLLAHEHDSLGAVFYAHKAANAGSAGENNSDRWLQFGLNYQGDPAIGLVCDTVYYKDDDGDGYGDPNDTTQACGRPSGYATDTTDCDDGDATIYPGAIEYCNRIDDDCDGEIDEACIQKGSFFFPIRTKEGETTIIYID